MAIVPVAKGLYLCDYHIGYSNGKVDLYGIFNAIRPPNGYPYTRGRFCVFAQMVNGLGKVPVHVDFRFPATDELLWVTQTRELTFPDRTTVVQMAFTLEGWRVNGPGLYLLELFCDNTWVCDAPLHLL
jgi:hypothetical protein